MFYGKNTILSKIIILPVANVNLISGRSLRRSLRFIVCFSRAILFANENMRKYAGYPMILRIFIQQQVEFLNTGLSCRLSSHYLTELETRVLSYVGLAITDTTLYLPL